MRGGRGRLAEPGRPQAAIAAEDPAADAADRPGGEGRQLMAAVGLAERPVRHAEPAESLAAAVEVTFVGNAADDEMRVGQGGREEEPCGFDGRVAGLDDLLGVRQVLPHEEVDIRGFVALVKGHGLLLEGWMAARALHLESTCGPRVCKALADSTANPRYPGGLPRELCGACSTSRGPRPPGAEPGPGGGGPSG